MKKYLLIATMSLLLTAQMKAQTNVYHQFPDSNAVWGMISGCTDFPCGDWTYIVNYYGGDTVISGYNYKKIYEDYLPMTSGTCCAVPMGLGAGYLREDTTSKKVYWRASWMTSDTLLYDFTQNVGDTLKGYFGNCPIGIITVQSIDSALIGSSYRKRINFDTTGSCSEYSIIEGIGATTGLTACYYGQFEMGTSLQCFSVNGNVIYSAPCSPDTTPCGTLPINFNDYFVAENNFVTIFPIPTLGKINIQFQSIFQPIVISIYDIVGRKYLEKEIIFDNSEIDISFLSPGMYFLRAENNNKILAFKKIVKQ